MLLSIDKKLTDRLADLQKEISQTHKDMVADMQRIVNELLSKGWQKFEFKSTYFGSHYEYGEDDTEETYFFHPSIDLKIWKDVLFSHGHRNQSESYDKWEAWLEALPEDMYATW